MNIKKILGNFVGLVDTGSPTIRPKKQGSGIEFTRYSKF